MDVGLIDQEAPKIYFYKQTLVRVLRRQFVTPLRAIVVACPAVNSWPLLSELKFGSMRRLLLLG